MEDPIVINVRRRRSDDGSDKFNLFDNDRTFFFKGYQTKAINDDGGPVASAVISEAVANVQCQTEFSICSAEHRTITTTMSNNTECCHRLIDTQSIFAQCFEPEIDIEEVTLRKSRSDEKLGLTVSYSSVNGSPSISASDDDDADSDEITDHDDNDANDNTCGDIYICDILPDSIAAKDGRLRQGDQIIQINGKDISSKDETESLLAENKNSITLLISRCVHTDDEFLDSAIYCDEKDQNTGMSVSLDCEPSTYSSKSSLRSLSEAQKHQIPLQAITALDANACDHANIRAQLESVNKEISLLNSQISNMKFQKDSGQPIPLTSMTFSQPATTLTAISTIQPLKQPTSQQLSTNFSTVNCSKSLKVSPSSASNHKTIKNPENIPTGLANLKKSATILPDQSVHPPMSTPTRQHNTTGTITTGVFNNTTVSKIPSKMTQSMEIEHIYETIPEDSETDSYYCSPYDEMKDQSRVEQWLKSQDISDSSGIGDLANRPLSPPPLVADGGVGGMQATASSTTKRDVYLNQTTLNRIWRNNSSGDDYENSSSAYNTGDSCTSNPLTFELKTDDKNQSTSTLVFQPYSKQLEIFDNCKQCQLRYRKEKLISKSHRKSLSRLGAAGGELSNEGTTPINRSHQPQQQQNFSTQNRCTSNKNSASSDITRTIKLQNKLFRKAVTHNSQNINEISSGGCFTPSLSHCQLTRNTNPTGQHIAQVSIMGGQSSESQFSQNDENTTMVWKVKRRTDGTRYIVRRPVRRSLTTSSSPSQHNLHQYQQYSHHQEFQQDRSFNHDQIINTKNGGGIVVKDEIITLTEASKSSSYRHSSNRPLESRQCRQGNERPKQRRQIFHQQQHQQHRQEPMYNTASNRSKSNSRHIQKQWVI